LDGQLAGFGAGGTALVSAQIGVKVAEAVVAQGGGAAAHTVGLGVTALGNRFRKHGDLVVGGSQSAFSNQQSAISFSNQHSEAVNFVSRSRDIPLPLDLWKDTGCGAKLGKRPGMMGIGEKSLKTRELGVQFTSNSYC